MDILVEFLRYKIISLSSSWQNKKRTKFNCLFSHENLITENSIPIKAIGFRSNNTPAIIAHLKWQPV